MREKEAAYQEVGTTSHLMLESIAQWKDGHTLLLTSWSHLFTQLINFLQTVKKIQRHITSIRLVL